jgi:hypothetical protein
MSTMSKVIYSMRAFDRVPKETGRDMDPTSSIFFPLKLEWLRCIFQLLLLESHLLESREK